MNYVKLRLPAAAHASQQILLTTSVGLGALLPAPSLLLRPHALAAPPPSLPVRLLGMLVRTRAAMLIGLGASGRAPYRAELAVKGRHTGGI
jgi:hypothetical protein